MISRLFSSTIFSLLTTTLASYVFVVYQATVEDAGIAVGIFVIAALVSRLFAGRYIELVGRRRMLILSTAAFFLCTLGYYLPVGFSCFLIVRALHGLSFGVLTNTLNVVVISYMPDERRGEGLGYFSLSATVSAALGPFIGVYIIQSCSFLILFVICSLCALVSLVVTFFMHVESVELAEHAPEKVSGRFHLNAFFEASAVPISLIVFMANMCYASVTSFIDTYAGLLGLGHVVAWFFIVNAAVLLFSRPATGRLLDHRGDNTVVYPALIVLILGFLVLGFCENVLSLLVSAVLFAIGFGGVATSGQVISVKSASPYRMGLATSTFYMFSDAGLGFGPVIMGAAQPFVGYGGMYMVAAAISALSILLYYFVHGRYARTF